MDAKEMTLIAAELLDEKKALEVCSIDIADKSGFADYFVMATGMNTRHLTSLANDLEERFAKENIFLFAVVDTNVNPTGINYVIPGNDDAINAVDRKSVV